MTGRGQQRSRQQQLQGQPAAAGAVDLPAGVVTSCKAHRTARPSCVFFCFSYFVFHYLFFFSSLCPGRLLGGRCALFRFDAGKPIENMEGIGRGRRSK